MKTTIRTGILVCLLLSLSCLFAIIPIQSVQAQTSKAILVFDTQQLMVNTDQSVSIPLMLNTQGQAIDGLQIAWTMEGVTLANARLEINSQLPFTALKNEVTTTTGQAYLIPADPLSPFARTQPVILATLHLTPTSNGDLTINYDLANTLVASHETSSDILTPPSNQKVAIALSSIGQATPEPSSSHDASVPEPKAVTYPRGITLLPLIALLLGAGIWWWKKHQPGKKLPPAVQVSQTPTTTTQPVANLPVTPLNLTTPTAASQPYQPTPAPITPPATTAPAQPINTASIETLPPKPTNF